MTVVGWSWALVATAAPTARHEVRTQVSEVDGSFVLTVTVEPLPDTPPVVSLLGEPQRSETRILASSEVEDGRYEAVIGPVAPNSTGRLSIELPKATPDGRSELHRAEYVLTEFDHDRPGAARQSSDGRFVIHPEPGSATGVTGLVITSGALPLGELPDGVDASRVVDTFAVALVPADAAAGWTLDVGIPDPNVALYMEQGDGWKEPDTVIHTEASALTARITGSGVFVVVQR